MLGTFCMACSPALPVRKCKVPPSSLHISSAVLTSVFAISIILINTIKTEIITNKKMSSIKYIEKYAAGELSLVSIPSALPFHLKTLIIYLCISRFYILQFSVAVFLSLLVSYPTAIIFISCKLLFFFFLI